MVHIQDWRLEYYEPGDEEEIVELFETAFGEKRSLAFWRWRYEELPGATQNILLIRDEQDRLIGHYAALPLRLRYRSRVVTGALRIDFMVSPERQKSGLGSLLVDKQREHLSRNHELTLSFPNPRSTNITRRKGQHFVGEAPIYWRVEKTAALLKGTEWNTKVVSALTVCADHLLETLYRLLVCDLRADGDYAIEREGCFEGNLRGLADTGRVGSGIYFLRDEPFLRWRFDRNPEVEYVILFLHERKGGDDPVGYAVLAIKEIDEYVIGFIVDVLVYPPAFRPARYLLSRAVQWLSGQGVDFMSCLMTGKNAYTRALLSLGFMPVPHRLLPRNLGLSFFIYDPDIDRSYATNPDNWIITWADTDLV